MDKNKIDILKEIANIGTSHAAGALSAMLDRKVMIKVPSVKLLPLQEVAAELGGAEKPIIGLYFDILGDLKGKMMLIFESASGHQIASLLTGEAANTDEPLAELNESAVKELGNIVANSYLNAIAELLNVKLLPSIPFYAEDMLGAVIDLILIEISQMAEHAIILETEMSAEGAGLKGNFVIFPDERFLEELFARTRAE